jgi:dTDP-4-amino-4,6-dideoxygalactose transaminase
MRSAYGILALRQVGEAIEARQRVAMQYRNALKNVPGVRFFEDMPGVRHNYSYFPVFINAEEYGMTRDQLYFKLKEANVLGRRYFYPLISTFEPYRTLPSSAAENLPVATCIADEVICLPMHHELTESDVERVLDIMMK